MRRLIADSAGFLCCAPLLLFAFTLAGCGPAENPASADQPLLDNPGGGARLVIESLSDRTPNTDCTLPQDATEQGQTVEMFNVPRNDRIRARIKFFQKFVHEAKLEVYSKDPDIAQTLSLGEQPGKVTVDIHEGSDVSEPFLIEGVTIDKARLAIGETKDIRNPDDPNDDVRFPAFDTDIIVWDFEEDQIVDYNAMGNTNERCYVDGQTSPTLKPNMESRTTCGGLKPDAVAADGTSLQLARVKAGGFGKVCFTVLYGNIPVLTQKDYGGKFSDPIAGGQSTDSPATNIDAIAFQSQSPDELGVRYWGLGTYTPPSDFFEADLEERKVEVEVQFMALRGPGIPTRSHITAVKREIKIRRPPVILVHGQWSAMSKWEDAFKRKDPGWAVDDEFNYANSVAVNRSAPQLNARIDEVLKTMRSGGPGRPSFAITKVDLIAHSLGGVVSRELLTLPGYRTGLNYNKGKVRKFISLATPHRGTQIANLIINLHDEFFDPISGTHSDSDSADLAGLEVRIRQFTGGNVHQGALCDMAEGSVSMSYPSVADVKTYALTASDGSLGRLGGLNYPLYWFFSDAEEATHIAPYVFANVNDTEGANDTEVAVDSQNHNGNIYSMNNQNLDHGEIKNDSETSKQAYALLDRSGVAATSFTDGMPGNTSNRQGIPRPGIGRGINPATNENHDAINYDRQCAVGRPMNQNLP